ncbi:MAG: phosphate acyltransferase, partial [Gammaproteobacteria bacterium]|nr:phosphate acyltransferase [Gammaproteobacteria bacterium]
QGLNFVGFVEADDLFENLADVIVCYGLLGNVALKSMEGTARLLASRLHASHDRTPYRRILAMLSRTVLQELRDTMNPELHNGAYLFGLQGVVVKSHGASSQHRFSAALQQAARYVQHKMVPQMAHYLDNQ